MTCDRAGSLQLSRRAKRVAAMALFVNASNVLTSTNGAPSWPRGKEVEGIESESRKGSSQKTDGMPELCPANGPDWLRPQGPWKDGVSLQVRQVRAHTCENAEITWNNGDPGGLVTIEAASRAHLP